MTCMICVQIYVWVGSDLLLDKLIHQTTTFVELQLPTRSYLRKLYDQHFAALTEMFLHSDNAESRAVEGEIIGRLAVRVIDTLSRDAVTAANRVQETSYDCQARQVEKDHSDSGIVTLAGIEIIFVEALYPILE